MTFEGMQTTPALLNNVISNVKAAPEKVVAAAGAPKQEMSDKKPTAAMNKTPATAERARASRSMANVASALTSVRKANPPQRRTSINKQLGGASTQSVPQKRKTTSFLSQQAPEEPEQNSLKMDDIKASIQKELLMKPEVFKSMMQTHKEIFKDQVVAVVSSEFPNTLHLEDKLKDIAKLQEDTKKIQDGVEKRFKALLAETKK